MIDSDGQARLTGFGLSIASDLGLGNEWGLVIEWAGTVHICGTYRWMAPELLNQADFDGVRLASATNRVPSKPSDIYALAMVAIEVRPQMLWVSIFTILYSFGYSFFLDNYLFTHDQTRR